MKNKIVKYLLAALLAFGGIGGGYFIYDIMQEKGLAFNIHSFTGNQDEFKGWIDFKPSEQPFAASFPSKPKSITKSFPIPGSDESLPYQEYQYESDSHILSVSYTVLPDNWTKWSSGLVLKGALRVILKEVKGAHLIGKSSNTFKDHPALDYEHEKNGREAAGTLILVGNILYKVEVSYPAEERDAVQAKLAYFIESFSPAK